MNCCAQHILCASYCCAMSDEKMRLHQKFAFASRGKILHHDDIPKHAFAPPRCNIVMMIFLLHHSCPAVLVLLVCRRFCPILLQ